MTALGDITNLKRTIKAPANPSPAKKQKSATTAKKTHRKVFQAEKNLAPSVTYTNEKLSIQLEEQGNLRIQLFNLTTIALYKKAERTGKEPSDVKVSIPGARIQVGQGDLENHAAHSNASAHVVDDLKAFYKEQIVNEGVSPKKRALLSKAKNMPENVLDLIEKNHSDKTLVNSLIDEYWAESSLIVGTKLEFTLNATNKLPRGVNLGCDLALEKSIRPYMEELYTQVMKGEMTPDEATSLFQARVIQHFKSRIHDLENKQSKVKSGTDKADKIKDQLFYHKHELIGTRYANYTHLKTEFITDDSEEPIDVEETFNLFV